MKRLLIAIAIIMTLLYLVPSTEPIPDPDTCAPCGSFVRRGVAWPLSASESSVDQHKVRLLQNTKQGFSLTDQHVHYLESSNTCPTSTDLTFNSKNGLPFFTTTELWLNINMPAFDATHDMYINPQDYGWLINGVATNPAWNRATWQTIPNAIVTWFFDEGQVQLALEPQQVTGKTVGDGSFFCNINYFTGSPIGSVFTIELQHLGVTTDSLTITATNVVDQLDETTARFVLSNIVGTFFGQVSTYGSARQIYTCE